MSHSNFQDEIFLKKFTLGGWVVGVDGGYGGRDRKMDRIKMHDVKDIQNK